MFDMETFLIFSSIQKNGNILYICLCTLSSGTSSLPANDPKLLNFTLMNELLSKNNTVPEMYGTNEIKTVPNPVDLSNFIPPEGYRNFYDYTHPSNTKVNFRVYQTPMNVSNEVLNILKSKLTPGNIFTNFQAAITQTLNPVDGLFFYFSEDLTNRYKGYQINNKTNNNLDDKNIDLICEKKEKEKEESEKKKEKKKEKNYISKLIIDEQESHEKNEMIKSEQNKKKDKMIEEENHDFDKEKESFTDTTNKNLNKSFIIMFIIIFVVLAMNIGYYNMINRFFITKNGLDINDLALSLNSDDSLTNINKILQTKLQSKFYLFIQGIISFILLILIVLYIISNNNNSPSKSLYVCIIVFLVILSIIYVLIYYLYYNFIFYYLKSIGDDNFMQKLNYHYDNLIEKIFGKDKLNIDWGKLFSYTFSSKSYSELNSIDSNSITSNNNYQSGGNPSIEPVPAPLYNPKLNKLNKDRIKLDEINSLSKINDVLSSDIVKDKFKTNPELMSKLYYYIGIIIFFHIIGIFINTFFINLSNDNLVNFFVSFPTSLTVYIPMICLLIVNAVYMVEDKTKDKWSVITVICLTVTSLLLAIFGTPFAGNINGTSIGGNIVLYISEGLLVLSLIVPYIAFLISKIIKDKDSSDSNSGFGSLSAEESELLRLTIIHNEDTEKILLLEQELEKLQGKGTSSSSEKEEELAETIERLISENKHMKEEIERLTQLLVSKVSRSNVDELHKEIKQRNNNIESLKRSQSDLLYQINNLTDIISLKDKMILELQEKIQQLTNEKNKLEEELALNLVKISEYKDKITELEDSLKTLSDPIKIKELEDEIAEYNKLSIELRIKIKEKEIEMNLLNERLAAVIEELRNESLKIEGLNKELTNMKSELGNKNKKIEEIEGELQKSKLDLEKYKTELEEIKKQKIYLQSTIDNLEKKIKDNENTIISFESRIKNKNYNIERLKSEIDSRNNKIKTLNESVTKYKEVIRDLLTLITELQKLNLNVINKFLFSCLDKINILTELVSTLSKKDDMIKKREIIKILDELRSPTLLDNKKLIEQLESLHKIQPKYSVQLLRNIENLKEISTELMEELNPKKQ
jgi:hypothetical protein